MKLSQRQSLYEQYKLMTEEQLNAILEDDEYEDIAKEVAREILNSDRKEYHQYQEQIQQKEQKQERKYQAQQTDPLYDDIHQIANDVRFIKNLFIISIVAMIALIVISFLLK